MSCPSCGSEVATDARFCLECGQRLDEDRTSVQDTVVTPDDDGMTAPLFDADADPSSTEQTVTPALATSSLVSCPTCGAANSEARMLCGRCGTDLATGKQATPSQDVVQPGPSVDVVGPVDLGERRSAPRAALVVAAIIVVGAIIGVGIGVWAVRAGQPEDAAGVQFDEGVYPGEPVDLRVGGVGASSIDAPDEAVDFDPSNMVDAQITTSWRHDPLEQEAADVDLAFALEQPAWVTAVVVANGEQTDDGSFGATGRIRSMLMVVGDDAVAQIVLRDEPGYQRVTLPEPVLAQTVRFLVEESVAGTDLPQVAVAEVSFVGHEAAGADLERVPG